MRKPVEHQSGFQYLIAGLCIDLHANLGRGNGVPPAGLRVVKCFAVHHCLPLCEALGGYPYPTPLQFEEFRIGEIDKGQYVVPETAMNFRHMRVQAAVKAGIKINRVQQRIGGRMVVMCGDFSK